MGKSVFVVPLMQLSCFSITFARSFGNSKTGPNCCVNSSRTVILLGHELQSTATKNLIHIAQMVREGSITMYDYGSENENNKHYGQSSPPAYAMANIPDDFPLFLRYGGQDYLSDVNDVKILLDQLHNHNGDKLLVKFIEDYAHAVSCLV
nr:triacylglycerol lipase 2-like [Ipomoea trifida]